MGSFAIPLAIAATTVSAGLGVRTAIQQNQEGKIQQAELNRQADQEKIAATDREVSRRRRLNQILGTTIAETGARGIKFEGSPEAVARSNIERQQLEESGTKVSDLSRIAQLRRAGKGRRIQGKNAAIGTLLTTAVNTVGSGLSIDSAGE